ncbi:MAG TPA: choice-of-anchor J domain-containing protein, partial [Chitinophagales bacterium]|nr:choice-of-anchor J domain-containing protein [Chitinophagales bacterium]
MKKLTTSSVFFLFLLSHASAQVIFSEDFDGVGGSTAGGPGTYSFPAGWTLYNVDNRIPATQVAYVNDAWERREDFANNTSDSCAFSTSWYNPAGAADDWMFTPAITLTANNVLKWNAVAYDQSFPDGYEVRISTANPTVADAMMNAPLFTIPAENPSWTARSVNLQLLGYSNQTVYIAFRNNSNDQFLLLIDDVEVSVQLDYDAKIESVDTPSQYTIIPVSQLTPLPLGAIVSNNGGLTVTNVMLTVNVYDGNFLNVHSASSAPLALLAPGNTANLSAGSFTPSAVDAYFFEYIVSISEADGDNANDTMYWMNPIVTDDSTYARDDANVTGALGIGVPGGNLGQQFDIINQAELTSISFFVTRGYTGRPVSANIWSMAAGIPDSIIAQSDTFYYPDDSSDLYTIGIEGGPFLLTPGTYAVTMQEYDSTLALGQTSGLFTPGTTWVDFPGNPLGGWANNEDFGANFAKTYALRINIRPYCTISVDNVVTSSVSCFGGNDGTAGVVVSGASGSETYQWSNGGTTAVLTGLSAGNYSVTVTDAGCAVNASVSVTQPLSAVSATASATDETCSNCNDGSATVTASGGTPPYGYSWSNGATTQTISNLSDGSYEVTVTDSKGCTAVSSANVGTVGIAMISSDISFEAFPNPVYDNLSFHFHAGNAVSLTVEVFNSTGQRIYLLNENSIAEF